MIDCYIALGSNLEDRNKHISQAFEYLRLDPAIKIVQISTFIETEPHGGPPQPKFLNGVAKLKTSYSAQELLKRLQEIEIKLGRQSPHPKNQPRPIDLDILLYGKAKIDQKNLQIPNPRMWERDFVMAPLREIAPEIFKQKK